MNEIIIIIALTLAGEAIGEGVEGQRAVASVIWNRAKGDIHKLKEVCKAPAQFTCWSDGKNLEALKGAVGWDGCLTIAKDMVNGKFEPMTEATHFYDVSIAPPYWATGMEVTEFIGDFIMLKENK